MEGYEWSKSAFLSSWPISLMDQVEKCAFLIFLTQRFFSQWSFLNDRWKALRIKTWHVKASKYI